MRPMGRGRVVLQQEAHAAPPEGWHRSTTAKAEEGNEEHEGPPKCQAQEVGDAMRVREVVAAEDLADTQGPQTKKYGSAPSFAPAAAASPRRSGEVQAKKDSQRMPTEAFAHGTQAQGDEEERHAVDEREAPGAGTRDIDAAGGRIADLL
eukprot:CAMPEP_0170270642 /NCGR_PEP_ID=MMETSP0116_2-20130129/35269_1 /TAXON_ID=400756 /ORGANISM="Durinskia baltica, Strain CSIRO CS-38" /LENGTH=149 /DNA_ID=CAMNT_0010521841 /DNA_START=149 /DNA_END=595 /DNA_ORIENTATION=+